MENKKPFCYAPWATAVFSGSFNSGGIQPCCEWKGNSYKGSAKDYMTSTYLHDIKTALLNNDQEFISQNCAECLEVESIGNKSTRHYIHRDIDSKKWSVDKINKLDYRPDNLCNLKCRMCSMNSSSLIEEEFVKHGWAPLEKRTEDDVYELDIGYLEELALVGGEPTVNKKFYDILDYFIDNGRAKNMHLNYTTNCTSFNNPWIDRVKQFKSIHINLSIDAAGETYEYIRNGAEWNKVEKNIHKIIDFVSNHSKESDYNIQMVAMVYNFAVIEKWFEYFLQFDPDVINICPVQGPYGLEIIPPHIKTQKINFLKQYYPHPLAHKAVNFFFKNIEFNSQIATTYKTYNDWLDSIRATSLYKLDPIFEDILAKV